MAGMSGRHNTVTRELAVLQIEPLEINFKDIEESVQYIQVCRHAGCFLCGFGDFSAVRRNCPCAASFALLV